MPKPLTYNAFQYRDPRTSRVFLADCSRPGREKQHWYNARLAVRKNKLGKRISAIFTALISAKLAPIIEIVEENLSKSEAQQRVHALAIEHNCYHPPYSRELRKPTELADKCVYLLRDPRDTGPFFAGCGREESILKCWSKIEKSNGSWFPETSYGHRLAELYLLGLKPLVEITAINVTATEGQQKVRALIRTWGLQGPGGGILLNKVPLPGRRTAATPR